MLDDGLRSRSAQEPERAMPVYSLTKDGETLDDFYRRGDQFQMEEALGNWLRAEISRIEHEREPGFWV